MPSFKTLAMYFAIGLILTAIQADRVAIAADTTKPVVDWRVIPNAPKAAKDAAFDFNASGNRRYEATNVEECIDEGLAKAYAQMADEKQKNILTGKSKEVATYVGSSLAARSLGNTAGQTVTLASGAMDAKEAIDEVIAAQRQVDECLGENIAEGKISADVFANRREVSAASVGMDVAKSKVGSVPLLGGLLGGSKKQEEVAKPENDPTRIKMEHMVEAATKRAQSAAAQ